jgi:hypothetical protein
VERTCTGLPKFLRLEHPHRMFYARERRETCLSCFSVSNIAQHMRSMSAYFLEKKNTKRKDEQTEHRRIVLLFLVNKR